MLLHDVRSGWERKPGQIDRKNAENQSKVGRQTLKHNLQLQCHLQEKKGEVSNSGPDAMLKEKEKNVHLVILPQEGARKVEQVQPYKAKIKLEYVQGPVKCLSPEGSLRIMNEITTISNAKMEIQNSYNYEASSTNATTPYQILHLIMYSTHRPVDNP